MLRKGITARQIMTKEAFENAITVVMALGGSTNAVLHLLAIANEAEVELTLEDGTTQRIRWDGKHAWTRLAFHGKSPIAFAVIDPDGAVLVDQDRLNDFMRASNAPAPSGSRVFERLTYAAQLWFSGVLP